MCGLLSPKYINGGKESRITFEEFYSAEMDAQHDGEEVELVSG